MNFFVTGFFLNLKQLQFSMFRLLFYFLSFDSDFKFGVNQME
ncbi:hypothetical protein LEP1GSC151_0205 [Leptospira interrogans serovar Grippotyphosa str. LT2186]|uniref:Uncharacterized protein n=1 Tax=Leptospira interrogans serovar Grippotyphosa str. LT2186 TaxID=1001599 RepID=M3G0Y2_LEPIR|nr:hypothetical protein LEP1GSC151_0205 [Leptospira interrogans serovar Grippotyphosa str. LT2186]